ncbi:uracil-DNA glycosylase [Acidithiobacillus marinus]|uniref:uracil-DNA glycosylase n=1 Tax=Acidithiobacillus marinus TaxID=187490 RepID=UPI00209BCCD8|nr:uracil-DNA glycosylase [Acidithiobacillus marinus]
MHCSKCQALCASRSTIVDPDLPAMDAPCRVLVIGEAPGAEEDKAGKGFVGRAGQTLHHLMEANGFTRGRDYGCANVVRCRPPDNRRPTPREVFNCLPLLADTIRVANPTAVVTVGETSTRAITGIMGLYQNIQALHQYQQDPHQAEMLCHPEIKAAWPADTLLIPMPHTSPLAWNRNAPGGEKWKNIGERQIILAAYIRDQTACRK